MSFMAAPSVNVVASKMFLSIFFLSGAVAACDRKSHLFITSPQKMEALNGSCLEIPCSFWTKGEGSNSEGPTVGMWIKNTTDIKNLIYVSNSAVNKYPMNITGNLADKNCTTLFSNLIPRYTDTYYFRLESWIFVATAVCDPLHITVRDNPWRPTIQISGDVREKESVTITCSAPTPCPHSPPQLTWNLKQDSHSKTEENTDGTLTTEIQETLTLSHTHDGYNISCSAAYPVDDGNDFKTAKIQKILNVSYAPKDTSASISPSGVVSAGSRVNLSCSSRAKPPVSSFSWFKISQHGAIKVCEGDVYSFNVPNVTDGGGYYCVATNDLGNQTSPEVHLILEGDQQFGVGVCVTVKILEIVILYGTIIIFECWFRSRFNKKPVKETQEPIYVNTVSQT